MRRKLLLYRFYKSAKLRGLHGFVDSVGYVCRMGAWVRGHVVAWVLWVKMLRGSSWLRRFIEFWDQSKIWRASKLLHGLECACTNQ